MSEDVVKKWGKIWEKLPDNVIYRKQIIRTAPKKKNAKLRQKFKFQKRIANTF